MYSESEIESSTARSVLELGSVPSTGANALMHEVKSQPQHWQAVPSISELMTPMALLALEVQRGPNIAILEKLMALQKEWHRLEQEMAFTQAMASFKAEGVCVIRDKVNLQYKSKYVSLGQLVGTVTPILSRHGLSARWDLDQSTDRIKVTCILTHCLGHKESVYMFCPPDKSGSKNPIQEIKSAITYAKACTFESICGLASTDSNLDDDGNGSNRPDNLLPDEFFQALLKTIRESKTLPSLEENWHKAMHQAKSQADQKEFIKAKNEMKAQIGGGR